MEPRKEGTEDKEEWIFRSSSSPEDTSFDIVIGHIEELVIEPSFLELQNSFFDKYCSVFDEAEENKLEYTPIFNKYVELVEKYIEVFLRRRIPNFDMKHFLQQVESKKDHLDGEIFDILNSFSNFLFFKELILDYKANKEGKTLDLSKGILVTKCIFTGNNHS